MKRNTALFIAAACSAALLGGCFVEGRGAAYTTAPAYEAPTPVAVGVAYEPMYYNGYVVHYDTVGRPMYYYNGWQYVPSTYVYYGSYVSHYRVNRYRYRRWYRSGGNRIYHTRSARYRRRYPNSYRTRHRANGRYQPTRTRDHRRPSARRTYRPTTYKPAYGRAAHPTHRQPPPRTRARSHRANDRQGRNVRRTNRRGRSYDHRGHHTDRNDKRKRRH